MRRIPCRFTREAGPICYELPVFGDPAAGVARLTGSPFVWYWESARRERPAPFASRRLERLDESAARLLEALAHRDADELGLFVAAYGVHADAAPVRDAATITDHLRDFAAARQGPLEVVIVQLGDAPEEHLFVDRHPSPAAGELLRRLGADERPWRDVPYRRLGLAALESVFGV